MLHPYSESSVTILENIDNNQNNNNADEMAKYINQIHDRRQSIRKIKNNLIQLSGQEEDSKLIMVENLYDYWSWAILMLLIVWLLYICYTNKEHSTMITLYILAVLTLIYIFRGYILAV